MNAAVNAAPWVVRKALSPVTDDLLESWVASTGLGPNIDALKMQLLNAQGMLDSAQGKDIHNATLKELLHKLQQLAYGADDVLDELDYFRIQDALQGTYHAANLDAQSCFDRFVLNARHTAKAVARKLKCSSNPRDGNLDNQQDGEEQGCLSGFCLRAGCEMKSSPPPPTNQGVQEVCCGCMPKVDSCARSVDHSVGEIHSTGCALPVERIEIEKCGANGEELTELLSHFPKLTCLWIERCGKITGLAAQGHQTTMAMAIPASPTSSSDNISQHAQAGHYQRLTRRDDEVASAEQGLLLLPSQLQDFSIRHCDELCLLSNSLGNGNARDGLQSLNSLRILRITDCPKFLSSYSSSASSCFAFPTSLQSLLLGGIETLDCLSNLVSLHTLHLWNCPDLRGEGLWPLVAQGCLTRLLISRTPKFFTGWKLSSYSSKLEYLMTNGHVGVLTLPICSLLSSSLTKLTLYEGRGMERFTEEQEDALHLLNSLQELEFCSCEKLQRIPAGLTKLTNLKRLRVQGCPAIRSLPKDGLPSSLQELVICDCPAIKSLPKDGLPSSLLKLQVYGISEELKRQCHKLKGTIPIVADYEAKAF
ncbi:unnamed protein product [Alopecurus aequalis]